jgi:hypothetical protein
VRREHDAAITLDGDAARLAEHGPHLDVVVLVSLMKFD